MPTSAPPRAISHQINSFPTIRVADSDATYRIRKILLNAMVKSKRRGYWFRLSKPERSLYSLALTLKVKFKSLSLLRALVNVLKKLKALGDIRYIAMVKGSRLAWAFSSAAARWGHPAASSWRNDRAYIEYLGSFFVPRRA